MRLHILKTILRSAGSGAALLLVGLGSALAQQVNVTAAPTSVKLPDGSSVPMWGYSCDASQPAGSTVSCRALNLTANGSWSPILITVPTGTDLTISLTNSLIFGTNSIPTSMVIVGQLGGGLGTPTSKASPSHDNQGTTWPIANTGPIFTPPAQGPRVQSFGKEIGAGTKDSLTWSGLKPGTYLLESGTHPSIQATMGLIGMVVVTQAAGGAAYPNVNFNADVALLFSEIDPAQNNAVTTAVNTPNFSETSTHGISTSGPIESINVISGGAGYASAPAVTISGGGTPTSKAAAHAVIDTDSASPTYGQVTEIDIDNAGAGYSSTPSVIVDPPPAAAGHTTAQAISALALNAGSLCSGGAAACYPSVVNYSPLYYLINGVGFDKTNATASLFPALPGSAANPVTGNVLVRMVNAGSHMHVPTIVGSTTKSRAAGGFSLIAEDGNLLPGAPRIQNEVFMAAGKTYDVMIDAPTAGSTALPVFDRQLSLSANSISRDAGMLAYVSVNGNGLPAAAVPGAATVKANDDTYNAVLSGKTLTISEPAKGVIANDVNIMGVQVLTQPGAGTLTLNANGTFTYQPDSTKWATVSTDSFRYCGNGATSGDACATVTLNASALANDGISLCQTGSQCTFQSNVATAITVKAPGLLDGATDGAHLPLSVDPLSIAKISGGLTATLNKDGSFSASGTPGQSYHFDFTAVNSLGISATATATVNFPTGSGLNVTVVDGSDKTTTISSYRWIIEEDRTFFSDPNCTQNPPPAGCPGAASGVVPNFGTNFHTSYMPVIASGCTDDTACGNNQTVGGLPIAPRPLSKPSDVALCSTTITTGCLDPKKRYYISVLPGDAAQPFIAGYAGAPDCSSSGIAAGSCGHGMGGAPIGKGPHTSSQSVMVLTQPSPYPPATMSIFVFEDDYPLNGEHDAGGGVDVLSPNEAGLGGFQITLQDNAGGTGDATGSPTYDMFNMPLSNSLAGTLDPVTKMDACPLASKAAADPSQKGITGMIITCPTYESDGKTLSPLAGQALVKNLYQGRYGVVANPAADRIARGEEWVQTNTLDGQKAHDSFMRIGEPGYFQEFGPAGYHVTIGFANPKIINARGKAMCSGTGMDCAHEVKGHVTTARMSRTPDERLYGSGTHDSYSFTQCYVSLGDPDGAEFLFTKCDPDGNFDFTGVPAGNWKITTFDQWNDQVVDGITTPVGMCDPASSALNNVTPTNCLAVVDMGEVAVHQWQSNIYTRTFVDTNYTGISDDSKPGLPLVDTNIRFRDGSFSNYNNTDLDGYAGFNEVFPLFNWYVIETDSTRYKNSGTHVVYDAGGPVDGSLTTCAATGPNVPAWFKPKDGTGSKPCGTSAIAQFLANTIEQNPLPTDLRVPGSVYCAGADCLGKTVADGPAASDSPSNGANTLSTGRIDPAWVNSYGWQGYSGQNNFLEFGKRPFDDGENGGIHGHVVYSSTRPFDDPQLLLQLSWEPLVPHVRVNLYKEGLAADGVTTTLTLVDHTETSSFDDWAQGFRKDAQGNLLTDGNGNYIPNMNCPGQGTDTSAMPDPYFWYALKDQPQYLDLYNSDGTPANPIHPIAHDAQFKCYDGMHNWNQLQPAPYDGMYSFPSVTSIDPVTGKPAGSNCTGCIANPTLGDLTKVNGTSDPKYDPYRAGTPMLPDGKYVVEVVVPEGYELVKEEDKNILIGDNFIAPVVQEFGGLGSIFILPDQATISDSSNPNNPQNPTDNLGRTTLPSHEADTGNVETFWPCVGADHVVPDYISLFPGSHEVAPFAGATRHLCDRKEVTLDDQASAVAKFYVFTETHAASHFTGVITDDFTAEFDPFSPQFGEKYGPAYLPVSFKDWAGNEIERVYTDAWGAYNGLNYSTWEVNPPNPTGYGPTVMVGCMNDAGPVSDGKGGMVNDPLFQEGYSQFCYELPFMPAQTGYFDTPVVPTAAFAGGYNNPDCAYPDATPSIAEVDGDGTGPWISGLKGTVTTFAVTNGGSGYTSAPGVTVVNTGTGGTGASGAAVIAGSVSAVNLTIATRTANRGYSIAPTVTFNGGGAGSGAVATANMTGSVTSVTISKGGTYHRNASVQVTFSGGGGSGAQGTAQTQNIVGSNNKRVTGVNITNAGHGYTGQATVSFSQGTNSSNTAAGTVKMGLSVSSVTVNNGGSGYTSNPAVIFTGAVQTGGQAAAGNATDTNSVVAITVTNHGSGYSTAPTVTFNNTGTGGSGATATANIETAGTISIKALGDRLVENYKYTGPGANQSPYNQQKVTRHYNFGPAPSDFSNYPVLPAGQTYNCNSASNSDPTVCPYVTVGGQALTGVVWSQNSITGTVPGGIDNCPVQQQAQFGGSTAQCGQLVITAANGSQSVDTVTVTIGGKAPTVVKPGAAMTASGFGAIQKAIDSAQPGDLLIVSPGTYSEMLLMWKPVRLQGVGAASSVIDANPHPAGKLNPWRQRVVCLFGLALNGTPISTANPYNKDTSAGAVTCPSNMKFSVDRLPLEATVGWDATLNGNLAEQLIEPTLMGAYEGAGITVLGKGVWFPNGGADAFASDTFPTGTLLLNGTASNVNGCGSASSGNPFPGNFHCNPSSIDGLTVQNSSQGGGAIWAHAWAHNLQIANNRILNNQGTMSGGITIGQGEHPDAFLNGQAAVATVPGSCIADSTRVPTNLALPFCNNLDVNVHHNYISRNSSLGDELFSSTPAGAGGVTFCNGSDYYKFDFNWVCGNMSTGDGAGVSQVGLSYDGDIQHNAILYNQTTNPSIVTNGAGLLIMGAPDADPPCGITTDQDCVSDPGAILPSDGIGPGLMINANLILGNSADSGSGGGLRLQHINGTEVLNFPNGSRSTNWPTITGHPAQPDFQTRTPWNAVQITNNVIANNVAGIDGGGVSLLDALAVDLVNNTVISNNSTASSGVLLQTLFAPLASTGPGGFQTANCGTGQSCPQVAGLVSVQNSEVLTANMGLITPNGKAAITCPANHGTRASISDCTRFSVPVLYNDLFWKNRSLIIGVADAQAGFTNQQNTVNLYNPAFGAAAQSPAGSQAHTGDCDPNASIWDIGIRGDRAPGKADSGGKLQPTYSFLTTPGTSSTALETGNGANNRTGDPLLAASYCNGSRVPPEAVNETGATGSASPFPGWLAPPGTNESNALPAPPFTLSPAATVDEGNNWINLRWGPLSLNLPNPITGETLMDASLQSGSPAVDETPVIATPAFNPYTAAPSIDFKGNPRKTQSKLLVDAGAIESAPPAPKYSISVSPTSLAFGTVADGQTSTLSVTVTNTGNQQLTGGTFTFSAATPFTRNGGNCTATLNAGANCTIGVRFTAATGAFNHVHLTIAYNNNAGATVPLSGTGAPLVVTPSRLDFGSIGVSTPATSSQPQTLTLRNTSGGSRSVLIGTFPAGFSRATAAQGGGGSCGGTLTNGGTCTINVVFTPTAQKAYNYSGATGLSITTNGGFTVANSPVSLTGTGAAPNPSATLAPASWTPSQTRNCPGLLCFIDPAQAFTLTNTGNTAITAIGAGTLSGTNAADFTVVNLASTCGPASGQPLGNITTLAPGATCSITVQFRPLAVELSGTKIVTIHVSDVLGTQSVNISGTAN